MEKGIIFSKSTRKRVETQKSYSFVIGDSGFDEAIKNDKPVTHKKAQYYDKVIEKIIEPTI